ncbi:MAG: hypothetical protein HKN92_01615 [Chitinophagales bacterium]|nr:hypothetical protein [Chitinophagales bacterium]
MKNKAYIVYYLLMTFLILFSSSANVYAEEEIEQVKPRLRLNYFKHMDDKSELVANAYFKKDGEKLFCTGAEVLLFTSSKSDKEYSNTTVGEDGYARFNFNSDELSSFKDSSERYSFYVLLKESELFKERSDQLTITDAELKMEFLSEDSVKTLKVKLESFNADSGRILPVYRKPLKVFVERAFSPYPVGGDFNYSNEDGVVEITFPNDIFGDENGIITVIAKLDEDDDFGTIIAKSNIDWGLPYTDYVHTEKALLIGSSREAPNIIFFGIILTVALVWGYLIYIFYNIFRIKSLGKKVV